MEPLNKWNKPSDFPVINPAFSGNKNTLIYAATSSGSRQALPHFPFDTVVKLNVSTNTNRTWSAGARRFIGEPIFVAKGVEEDDGYILVVEVKNPAYHFKFISLVSKYKFFNVITLFHCFAVCCLNTKMFSCYTKP